MAVTRGHGNPNWTRDETILALDLYLRCGDAMPGPKDPRVVALSQDLRELDIHGEGSRRERFRNPDGVAFKLQNLRHVATGKGIGHTSAMDRAVWADFGGRAQEVGVLAGLILGSVRSGAVGSDVQAVRDDEEFAEGRVLTALHQTRERNPRLRSLLIAQRRESGPLACDVCKQLARVVDPMLGDAGFEAHHVVPLAHAQQQGQKTRLGDLALVCAMCHRMIHRGMQLNRGAFTIADLQAVMSPPGGSSPVNTQLP